MSERPFEIRTDGGDWAEADDEASAMAAARQLRRDARAETMAKTPTVHILFEGKTVLTIPPERSL